MKLGIIGEEMAATAVKLAAEHGASVEALHVVRVPLDKPLDAPIPEAEERGRGLARRGEGARRGARRRGRGGRRCATRAIGRAIVDHARERGVDLIVLGSSPRWRRQSRFFSPTVDFVLRQAPCEVLIVAFPQQRDGRGARRHLIPAALAELRWRA